MCAVPEIKNCELASYDDRPHVDDGELGDGDVGEGRREGALERGGDPHGLGAQLQGVPQDSEGEEQDDKPLAARVAPLVQSRRPKRGDVISYGIELGTEHERWGEAVVTSVSRTPHYYDVQRLDTHEKLGIYLLPNTAWHLGPRLECEREPLLHPSSRETSPLAKERGKGVPLPV